MESRLVVRRLDLQDEDAFFAALKQWDGAAGFLFTQGYEPGMKFSEYVELVKAHEVGQHLPPGWVPATTYCGFMGSEIACRFSLRHSLNDFLLKIGGHIGYGVLPKFRRRGFAKIMLQEALAVAKGVGISRALLTCDDDNIGSIKTIESCGGILENKVDAGPDKPLKRRYWIEVT